MSLFTILNRIEKKYALGIVLAALFGCITIYTEFIRDHRPRLRFEIVSNASVLDVKEQVGNLEIFYNSEDIKKAQKSLRVIILRVINEGPDDILKGLYDENKPLGFRIVNGTLLRAEVVETSSPYLRESLDFQISQSNTATIKPIIIESKEWFTVKSLVLHPETVRPELEPVGKIAGVKEVEFVDLSAISSQQSFLEQSFSGGLRVQLARGVAYFLAFFLIVVGVTTGVTSIFGSLAKKRRRGHVAEFKKSFQGILDSGDEFLFRKYVRNNIGYLGMIEKIAKGDLTEFVEKIRHTQEAKAFDPHVMVTSTGSPPLDVWYGPHMILELRHAGLLVNSDNKWTLNRHTHDTLGTFLEFLRKKGITYEESRAS